jgi:hypothetical protein
MLFGVNATDIFGYEHEFWTTKTELNSSNPIPFVNSFKLKHFYEKQITQIMIVSQYGNRTVLTLPSASKLMDLFISTEV